MINFIPILVSGNLHSPLASVYPAISRDKGTRCVTCNISHTDNEVHVPTFYR